MCACFISLGCAVQVTYQQLAPALQVTLLNDYLAGTVINPALKLAILTLTQGLPITAAVLNSTLIQGVLQGLSPIAVDAGAVATTTIATTPVGTCTALTIAYAGEWSVSPDGACRAAHACRPLPAPEHHTVPASKC